MLGPYLAKLCAPEPAVYTVAHAAVVMQVSEDTISRLVKSGVLPRVPHLDGKILILAPPFRSWSGARVSD
jgi:hypothetical protein